MEPLACPRWYWQWLLQLEWERDLCAWHVFFTRSRSAPRGHEGEGEGGRERVREGKGKKRYGETELFPSTDDAVLRLSDSCCFQKNQNCSNIPLVHQ